jgi:cell division protein YceG involved in septum cleavage
MLMRRAAIRFLYGLALLLVIFATAGVTLLLESKIFVYNQIEQKSTEPFPVGVDPVAKQILEQPEVDRFYSDSLAVRTPTIDRWQDFIAGLFYTKEWYQNLASPVQRIAVIWPGERHEQVVSHFGDVLGWDKENRETFAQLIQTSDPIMLEGKFLPGKYVLHRDAKPEEVAEIIYQKFSNEILVRYSEPVSAKVPLEEALTIASLLEREASDFSNMREVAGIIWNRLFIDMPLQLDATLQYARANNPYEPRWWPIPRPSDKFIDSPYNTYQNVGLPPGPIANPSPEAVLAALNPIATDCLFYFHVNNGDYYCSPTYDEHVKKLRSVFGYGR